MIRIEPNKDLKTLNTFGISARAAGYAEFRNASDLRAILSTPQWRSKPWYVISGGSNILFTADYDGLILHPVAEEAEVVSQDGEFVSVRAQAGLNWDTFVSYCVEQGFGGVENLSDIPGYVGACPVQNIGAYGSEVKDTIVEVEAYLPEEDRVGVFTNEECRFGYRDSVFKNQWKGKAIILSVTFRLSLEPAFNIGYGDLSREVEALGGASLKNVRAAVMTIRSGKLPDPKVLGNSGSFFKNPVIDPVRAEELKEKHPDMPAYPAPNGVKLAAGWLIDQCGLKGYRKGDAGVHERQALVLVNYGGASGSDIIALAEYVISSVHDRFGVTLQMEVNRL